MGDSSCTVPVSRALNKCINSGHQIWPSGKAQNYGCERILKGGEKKSEMAFEVKNFSITFIISTSSQTWTQWILPSENDKNVLVGEVGSLLFMMYFLFWRHFSEPPSLSSAREDPRGKYWSKIPRVRIVKDQVRVSIVNRPPPWLPESELFSNLEPDGQ